MIDPEKLPKLPFGQGGFFVFNDTTLGYRKTIKLENGKKIRKTVFGSSPNQCMEKMKQEERNLNNKNKNASFVTLNEEIQNWLINSYQFTVKQQTYERLNKIFHNQIESSPIGHSRYQSITSDEIQLLLTDLNNKKYSQSTIKKVFNLLNMFYAYVSVRDKFDNPMLLVKMPKISQIKAESKEIAWLEEDEIDRFIKACDKTYNNGRLKYKYGYILAANIYLGMRGGELLALQWKDIDFDKNTIYVSKTLIETENKDYVSGTDMKRVIFTIQPYTKTSQNRYVPINSKAKELLNKYYNVCQYKDPEDYVISTTNRKTNTLKNISDIIKCIEQEGEIEKPNNTHILRHTCASLYFRKGVPVETICKILGNSREVCEKTYIHFVEEQLKEAASKIDIIEI